MNQAFENVLETLSHKELWESLAALASIFATHADPQKVAAASQLMPVLFGAIANKVQSAPSVPAVPAVPVQNVTTSGAQAVNPLTVQ